MKKILFFSLGAAFALSSCTKTDGVTPTLEGEVTFTSSITSSATRVTDSEFEDGDAISVFASNGSSYVAENLKYESVNGIFTSATPIVSDGSALTFAALYPYTSDLALSGTITMDADQSNEATYEASDILTAVTAATSEICPELNFSHALSAVQINVKSTGDASSVVVNALTSVDYSVASLSFAASGSAAAVTPLSLGDNTYQAVVAPQTIAEGTAFIEVTVDGVVASWYITDAIELAPGYKYVCNVDVTYDGVFFSGDIAPWGDGGKIDATIGEGIEGLHLSDFADGYIPTEDTWVICDMQATTESFTDLKAALTTINSSRSISIEFPYLKAIPESAFEFAWKSPDYTLVSVSAPVALTIGEEAFYNCRALTTIDMPAITTIGGSAFYYCEDLTSVEFSAVTAVGYRIFYSCKSLTSVKFPNATTIDDWAFSCCYTLKEVEIPLATSIGAYAFDDCSVLATVDFPLATWIGDAAFEYCYRLTSVEFPAAKMLESYAFRSCTGLENVKMPVVTEISNNAFYNCDALTNLSVATAEGTVLTMLGTYAFYNGTEYNEGNVTLTLGESNVGNVAGNTLTVLDQDANTISYTFKEIILE